MKPSKFVSISNNQSVLQAKNSRPMTSSAVQVTDPQRGQGSNFIRNIHTAQRSQVPKNKLSLLSEKEKQSEINRLNSQKQIKVPQSQYGLKPVNNLRPSATTQQFSRLNSSVEVLNKEASVKQLRMSNYMQGNSQ